MATIKLICKGKECNQVFEVAKTKEIPGHVTVMYCSFCPMCEELAEAEYEEWWNEEDKENEIKDPNQLNLF